jgi:hypothetical protein
MKECEYISGCPMFKRFTLDPIKEFWIISNCKNEAENNVRGKAFASKPNGLKTCPKIYYRMVASGNHNMSLGASSLTHHLPLLSLRFYFYSESCWYDNCAA